MKKTDVKLGGVYRAKVAGVFRTIRIEAVSPFGGWTAINTETGRSIKVRTAARLSPAADWRVRELAKSDNPTT